MLFCFKVPWNRIIHIWGSQPRISTILDTLVLHQLYLNISDLKIGCVLGKSAWTNDQAIKLKKNAMTYSSDSVVYCLAEPWMYLLTLHVRRHYFFQMCMALNMYITNLGRGGGRHITVRRLKLNYVYHFVKSLSRHIYELEHIQKTTFILT